MTTITNMIMNMIHRRARSFFGGGGGGVHFKLELTSCHQSFKYISLYNTERATFSSLKETSLCVRKIRNIVLSITHW